MPISPSLRKELAEVCKTYSFADERISAVVNSILSLVIADRKKIDFITAQRRFSNLTQVLSSYDRAAPPKKVEVLARKLEVIRTGRTLKTINDLFTSLVEDDNMEDFMEFVFEVDQILKKYRREPITDTEIDTLKENIEENSDESTELDDTKVRDTKEIKNLMPGKRKVAKIEEPKNEDPIEYNSAKAQVQAQINGQYLSEGYRTYAASGVPPAVPKRRSA